MARRNAAPLCQDDDPQSGPVTNSLWFASVTLQPNQLDQRITPLAIRESRPAFPSQYATLKCVDALARLRGEGWGEGQTPRWTVARAPHPTPLPVKNGEREQTECVARVDLTSSKRALDRRRLQLS